MKLTIANHSVKVDEVQAMQVPSSTISINQRETVVHADPDMPLLWVLRDLLGLTGTKYGCGVGVCGACTIHQDGVAVRSCQVTLRNAVGHKFTTIEGLGVRAEHPCQRAWIEEDVSQCGYCQPGMIMMAAALLHRNPRPTEEEINAVMSDFVCRCGTYGRIRRAIHRASAEMSKS